jgi:hypothetical protein
MFSVAPSMAVAATVKAPLLKTPACIKVIQLILIRFETTAKEN